MDFISSNIAELPPSQTLSIADTARQMLDEGKDVCSFGAGEPDMDTPNHIKQAAIKALEAGETKYSPVTGVPALKQAIAEKFIADNNLEYSLDQIVVSCGARQSCFNTLLATCGPGDEVIIPAPYWTSYPEMVRMTGAEPVIVETTQETGWKMTADQFDEAMSPMTKLVILNSPGNPTGAVYTKEELEKIGEVAASEDILILSDEIYEKLIYGEAEHVSIASLSDELKELTITVNGFSKAYSMTGWRLGYLAAAPAIAKAVASIQSHTTSGPTTFAQFGGIAALHGDQQIVSDMRDEFDMRRLYMFNRFQAISNIRVIEPEGAFYFLVNIEPIGIKSMNFAEKLLSRREVAVVPGIAFGADHTIRFSYATSLDIIKNGLDRFEEFCRSH